MDVIGGSTKGSLLKPSKTKGLLVGRCFLLVFIAFCTGIGFMLGTMYARDAEARVAKGEASVAAQGGRLASQALQGLSQQASQALSVLATRPSPICYNTCSRARDGICNEGRVNMSSVNTIPTIDNRPVGERPPAVRVYCDLGTDCADCGVWQPLAKPAWLQGKAGVPPSKPPISLLIDKGVEVRVRPVGDWGAGSKFVFAFTDPEKDTAVSREMEAHQVVERGITKIFSAIFENQCIKPDGSRALFVDVGANFGWHSLVAASMGCRVIAFEPVSHFRAFLEYNVHLNNLSKLVDIRSNVVSGTSGVLTTMMIPNKGIWGTASVAGINADPNNAGGYTNSTAVSIRLDEVIKEDVLAMKVDVEGWEWSVLSGADQFIKGKKKFSIENIVLEYSPGVHEWIQDHTGRIATIQMLIDMVENGFRIAHIGDGDSPIQTANLRALPTYKEVKGENLKYDLFDAKRYKELKMGCPIPDELSKYEWPCNSLPENLNPRSFRCVFGHNTNIWASKNTLPLQSLTGSVGMMGLDQPHSDYFIVDEWGRGIGMRDCKGMELKYQVRHRCRCTDKSVCGEEEALVQRLATDGKIASNYHIS